MKMNALRSAPAPQQESEASSATMQGDLSIMSCGDLLTWIELREKSGILTLVSGTQKKRLLLQHGRLAGLVSTRMEEAFEHQLLASGALSRLEIACAEEESRRLGVPLPRYLQMNNVLCAEAQEEILNDRISEAICDLLGWESGRFNFSPGLLTNAANITSRVPISAALQAARDLGHTQAKAERTRPAQEVLLLQISRRLQGGDFEIPTPPKTLQQIQRSLTSPYGSVHDVLKIVMADPTLTSKILKVVNSSFYNFSNPVTSLQHAMALIGLKSLLGIVTSHALTSAGQPEVSQVMIHGFKCAYAAKWLAGAIGEDEDAAFVCGLLHNIGKPVLYTLLREYALEAEGKAQILADYQTQAGMLLATHWKLPPEVLAVIAPRQHPAQSALDSKMVEIVAQAHRLVVGGNAAGSTIPADLPIGDVERFRDELQHIGDFVATLL